MRTWISSALLLALSLPTSALAQEEGLVDDPESEDLRWRVKWNHVSNELPLGLRGAIRYVNFSDFKFFRDFDRDLNRVTIRSLYSSAFLSGAWGAHSMNLLVDDRERIRTMASGDIRTGMLQVIYP